LSGNGAAETGAFTFLETVLGMIKTPSGVK
jgi:hypothetical protein